MPRTKQPQVNLSELLSRVDEIHSTVTVLDSLTDDINLYDLQGRVETLEDSTVDVMVLQNQVEILEGSLANLEERLQQLEENSKSGVTINIQK